MLSDCEYDDPVLTLPPSASAFPRVPSSLDIHYLNNAKHDASHFAHLHSGNRPRRTPSNAGIAALLHTPFTAATTSMRRRNDSFTDLTALNYDDSAGAIDTAFYANTDDDNDDNTEHSTPLDLEIDSSLSGSLSGNSSNCSPSPDSESIEHDDAAQFTFTPAMQEETIAIDEVVPALTASPMPMPLSLQPQMPPLLSCPTCHDHVGRDAYIEHVNDCFTSRHILAETAPQHSTHHRSSSSASHRPHRHRRAHQHRVHPYSRILTEATIDTVLQQINKLDFQSCRQHQRSLDRISRATREQLILTQADYQTLELLFANHQHHQLNQAVIKQEPLTATPVTMATMTARPYLTVSAPASRNTSECATEALTVTALPAHSLKATPAICPQRPRAILAVTVNGYPTTPAVRAVEIVQATVPTLPAMAVTARTVTSAMTVNVKPQMIHPNGLQSQPTSPTPAPATIVPASIPPSNPVIPASQCNDTMQ